MARINVSWLIALTCRLLPNQRPQPRKTLTVRKDAMKAYSGVDITDQSFLIAAQVGGKRSDSRPIYFIPDNH